MRHKQYSISYHLFQFVPFLLAKEAWKFFFAFMSKYFFENFIFRHEGKIETKRVKWYYFWFCLNFVAGEYTCLLEIVADFGFSILSESYDQVILVIRFH